MARDFYPFVEKDQDSDENQADETQKDTCEVRHPARIAVYDDAAAAPRVVIVEPSDVRTYLEEITATVNRLSHEQGGTIPFMVIREIVENFIHAYFQAPTITILDNGNTIRFSDQGPGIKEKNLALEYGTTSATEEMKRYIRGVGSGLPYAQQYMADKGGSLQIEDNIQGGTVVTISIHPADEARELSGSGNSSNEAAAPTVSTPWQQPHQPTYQQQGYGQFYQQPQQMGWTQTQPASWPPSGQPTWQQQQPSYQQSTPYGQAPYEQNPPTTQDQTFYSAAPTVAPTMPKLTERGQLVMDYLAEHESCGPTDLTRACGLSGPTWSRELSSLANAGLVIKDGQKYRLTTLGRAYV